MIKNHISDLAVFGGPPTFDETLHVGRPNVGDRQRLLARIEEMLDRRWFTNHGPFVHEFEQHLAAYLGVKHCIAMCNATIALEVAIRALDLKGEVIVPAFTFIATAHALQWQAITPVFCDVDPEKHTLDPRQIERMITPLTTGIIGVHVWGHPCDIEAIEAVARRHNLKVLYDAAHAFGCSYKGRMLGSFGSTEVFSFHATKFFNTFEGGAVTTDDDELAGRIRLMQNFGFSGMDNVVYIGTNGKMSEISAAMGLTGLDSLDEFIAINQRNYNHYQSRLNGIPGLRMQTYDGHERNNYQYIVVEVDDAITGIGRDRLMKILHAERVRARRYFYPGCHRMAPYNAYFPHAHLLLPVTEALVHRVLSLPTGTAVSLAEIDGICDLIEFSLLNSQAINQRFDQGAQDEAA